MTPQVFQSMSTSQQEKVIEVCQSQVDTKKMEVEALKVFMIQAPVYVEQLAYRMGMMTDAESTAQLKAAVEQYFAAKLSQASVELEQLELSLKAIKSMQSPILGARFNPKFS